MIFKCVHGNAKFESDKEIVSAVFKKPREPRRHRI